MFEIYLNNSIVKNLFFVSFFILIVSACGINESTSVNPVSNSVGIAGSLASMIIVDKYLYIVDNFDLKVLDITNAESPVLVNIYTIGFGIETIFNYKNNLFIGSQNAMYIYEIKPNGILEKKSLYQHLKSCDPVISDSTYAYVTVRSSTNCNITSNINELSILDITDINKPVSVSKVSMTAPVGLGIKGNYVYVCDKEGLKVLDVTDKAKPIQVNIVDQLDGLDVIVLENSLLVIGNSYLTQLDITDRKDPKVISTLFLK
jgi:hypothetical protein